MAGLLKAFIALIALMWLIAFGLIGAFAYIRLYVITDDAFDPMRPISLNYLWAACLVFIVSAGVAKAAALFVR